MPSVLIADDHEVVRQGLRMILEKELTSPTLAEARNADEVMTQIGCGHWDLLLLDLCMPGRGGLEVLKEVKRACPNQKVLVLSMQPENQFAVRTLKAGACGYVSKDSGREELMRAVRLAISGRRYVSAELASTIVDGGLSELPHCSLSNREHEIMCALAGGRGISEIAAGLDISPKTVSTHRKRILEKMRMNSNADLTRYALENGLL
jgi:two-component system, NarL family, invasion response regulator UvrY